MTYSATAAIDKERYEKALHHEIARAHFSHGFESAIPSTRPALHNLVGHFGVQKYGNEHMHGISRDKQAAVRSKARSVVADRHRKIESEATQKHGNNEDRIDSEIAKKHRDLGTFHARKSGAAGHESGIPGSGQSWS